MGLRSALASAFGRRPREALALPAATVEKVAASTTIGVGGTVSYGGYLQTTERSPKLQGQQKYTTFQELVDNVAVVAAGFRFHGDLIGGVTWRADPGEGANAQRWADVVEEEIAQLGTPWRRVTRKTSSFLWHGSSVQVWTARRRPDGLVGLLDVEARPQHTIYRWELDESGRVEGMIQRSPQTLVDISIPRSRCVYVVDDLLSDSPEGKGVLRHMVPLGEMMERYVQLEGLGYDMDLRGIPIGYMPKGDLARAVEAGKMTVAEKTAAENGFKDFLQDRVRNRKLALALDSTPYSSQDDRQTPSSVRKWAVEILRADAGAQPDLYRSIARLNWEMAILIGVQHLLLGFERGTQALSESMSDNMFLAVNSTLAALVEQYQADLVRGALAKLNGWTEEETPRITCTPVRREDAAGLAKILATMAQATGPLDRDDPAADVVRERAGLPPTPKLDEDEDAAIPRPVGGGDQVDDIDDDRGDGPEVEDDDQKAEG